MKITFLGTGTSQGIPVINSKHPVCFSDDKRDKRLRVSVLVSWDDYAYVIDTGPDFRYQMLRANVQKIDGILFTHEHADHVAGFDDIRPFCFQMGSVPIYGSSRVLKTLKERFAYVFEEKNKYPGAPTVTPHALSGAPFVLGAMEVIPIEVMHGSLEVLGFRFQNLAYITDVKTIPERALQQLKGLEVLVLGVLRKEPHHSHLSLDEALEIIALLNPKKAYLTHISHRMGFHEQVEQELPDHVFLAYDELEIEL